MLRGLAAAALLLLAACARPDAAGPAAAAPQPAYTDLSQAFVDFWDRTRNLDADARLAAFKQEIVPLYPAFYAPRYGATQEKWDQRAKRQIADFPKIRDRYVAVQAAFPAAYASARQHFARYFPGSDAALPTYILHSLGEMDGGTRQLDGRNVMVFGADGMALYHTPKDIGVFFDHELFHVEHGAYFAECETVWCALWTEGLATAASEKMNPGASLKDLMLETPRPIAPEVDAAWAEALCFVAARIDSTEQDDYRNLFMGGTEGQRFPPRWGYYIGYRLAQRALAHHSIQKLAHMPAAQAEPLLRATLSQMTAEAGPCHP